VSSSLARGTIGVWSNGRTGAFEALCASSNLAVPSIAGLSNGRITDSESVCGGSTPSLAAIPL
jgi:hypothetical protein